MIPSSLIPDLRALRPDQSPEDNLLSVRLVCRFLADNARELQVFEEGQWHPLRDIVDFANCLRQIANAARLVKGAPNPPVPAVPSESIILNREVRSLTDVSGESGRQVSPHPDPLISEGGAVRADQEEGEDCADGKGRNKS
jgi:hypothetical protein